MISTIKQQTKDLLAELNRVDWPSKEKVLGATYAVVTVSLFVGYFLARADFYLSIIVELIKRSMPVHNLFLTNVALYKLAFQVFRQHQPLGGSLKAMVSADYVNIFCLLLDVAVVVAVSVVLHLRRKRGEA